MKKQLPVGPPEAPATAAPANPSDAPLSKLKLLSESGFGRGFDAKVARSEVKAINRFIRVFNDMLKKRDAFEQCSVPWYNLDGLCRELLKAIHEASGDMDINLEGR